jgi:hypothetical protein
MNLRSLVELQQLDDVLFQGGYVRTITACCSLGAFSCTSEARWVFVFRVITPFNAHLL